MIAVKTAAYAGLIFVFFLNKAHAYLDFTVGSILWGGAGGRNCASG